MDRSYVLTVAPTVDPVTLAQAKAQCRLDVEQTEEDPYVTHLIAAARQWVEQYTHRALLTQTWRLTLAAFADRMRLPLAAPLQSVTHVKYYDTAGVQQTLSTSRYLVLTDEEPGLVSLAPDQTWPDVQTGRPSPVQITYVAGWAQVSDVPAALKQAMLLLVEQWYLHREPVAVGAAVAALPFTVEALCAPYRVWTPEGC